MICWFLKYARKLPIAVVTRITSIILREKDKRVDECQTVANSFVVAQSHSHISTVLFPSKHIFPQLALLRG